MAYPSCHPKKKQSSRHGVKKKNRVQELPPCLRLCFFWGGKKDRPPCSFLKSIQPGWNSWQWCHFNWGLSKHRVDLLPTELSCHVLVLPIYPHSSGSISSSTHLPRLALYRTPESWHKYTGRLHSTRCWEDCHAPPAVYCVGDRKTTFIYLHWKLNHPALTWATLPAARYGFNNLGFSNIELNNPLISAILGFRDPYIIIKQPLDSTTLGFNNAWIQRHLNSTNFWFNDPLVQQTLEQPSDLNNIWLINLCLYD